MVTEDAEAVAAQPRPDLATALTTEDAEAVATQPRPDPATPIPTEDAEAVDIFRDTPVRLLGERQCRQLTCDCLMHDACTHHHMWIAARF